MTMTMIRRGICLFLTVGLLPAVSFAQSPSASEVLGFLVTNQTVATGDFVKDAQAAEATRATLARSLLVEMTTFPVTTASGGFSYRFDPALGTLERVSQGFGPFFVDRAEMAGRGHASLSVTYRSAMYKALDGRALREGFVTNSNRFRDEPGSFDVDLLSLNMRADTVTVFANYGLSNRMDVAVAVPVVRIGIDGERTNTYRGTSRVQARANAESAGFGDIPVRTKIQIVNAQPAQMSGALEVQLPTGDPDNLRGTGRAGFKGALLVSARKGAFEGHANGGVSVGGLARQTFAAVALTMAIGPRITLSSEALLRRVAGSGVIREISEPHPLFAGVDTTRLLPSNDGTSTATLVAGVRWNVAGTWLVNAYALFPATDAGLTARVSPALSIDYSFVR
jgi:hypothetical protein